MVAFTKVTREDGRLYTWISQVLAGLGKRLGYDWCRQVSAAQNGLYYMSRDGIGGSLSVLPMGRLCIVVNHYPETGALTNTIKGQKSSAQADTSLRRRMASGWQDSSVYTALFKSTAGLRRAAQ